MTQNDSGQIIATKPPFVVTPNGSLGSGNPPQFRKYFDLPGIVPLILIDEENVHRDRYLKGNAGAAGLSFRKIATTLRGQNSYHLPGPRMWMLGRYKQPSMHCSFLQCMMITGPPGHRKIWRSKVSMCLPEILKASLQNPSARCTTLPLWGSLALGTGAATVTATWTEKRDQVGAWKKKDLVNSLFCK